MLWTFVIDLAAAILLGTGWQGVAVEPQRREGELLNTSGPSDDWEKLKEVDPTSGLTIYRVHGGITPGQGNLPVP